MRFLDVSRVRSRFDEGVVTRDGVRLSVDLYLPPEPGCYPAVVTRTPYDNNRMSRAITGTTLLPARADRLKKLAVHGFIVVACDVRGRGDSEGSFTPFVHEAADGADTLKWVRNLPEFGGTVGVYGTGYAGFAALAAATEAPVDAAAVWSPFGRAEMPYRGGALRLEWLFWMHLVAGRTPQPVDVPQWEDVFRHRPLTSMAEALGREDLPWASWLDGSADLEPLDLEKKLRALTAPTLFVTGWWDGELTETVNQSAAAMQTGSAKGSALVIGPWDAQAVRQPSDDVGGIEWGARAAIDPDELLLEWFSKHLKCEGRTLTGTHVFVTGRNEWSAVTSLNNPSGATTLWLTSTGRANTRRGDGRLVANPPTSAASDRLLHDPNRPVLWSLSGASFSRTIARLELDTAFATARDEVLVYAAEPTLADVLLSGRPTLHLWVVTEADDADWVVVIEDVFPNGLRSVALAHAVARAASVDHFRPGHPTELRLELSPLAHELLVDHSLRLLVAPSLWPVYAVNLGGADYLHDTKSRILEQTVLHGPDFPSRLELPTVTPPERQVVPAIAGTWPDSTSADSSGGARSRA